jgi:SAM-dependent methyltransferase
MVKAQAELHMQTVDDRHMLLRQMVRCPVCKGALNYGGIVACSACGRRFAQRQFCLDLIPYGDLTGPEWETWNQLQANGLLMYEADPENNLAVSERWDAVAFRRFCNLSGTVLDIGCGIQGYPSYVDSTRVRTFVGVDPLGGGASRSYAFVQALGEFLPFHDGTFDGCLFATSLDHLVLPQNGLFEAARILRTGGTLFVWHGCIHRPAGPVVEMRRRIEFLATTYRRRTLELARSGQYGAIVRKAFGRLRPAKPPQTAAPAAPTPELVRPDGAEDEFHLRHITEQQVCEWAAEAGLSIIKRKAVPSSYVSYHLFLALKKI